MTLARSLGFPTRRALYAALTAEELVEWERFYECDPWGPERNETLLGVLCSLTDACHRAKGQPEKPLHYMPFVSALHGGGKKKTMTLAQAKGLFARIKKGFERASKKR